MAKRKARLNQRIWAALSPRYAINDDGYLVTQDGYFDFDSSDGGYAFLDDLSDFGLFWYKGFDGSAPGIYAPSSSDAFSDPDQYVNDLYNSITESADQVNQGSINAADRAMEFEKQQIDDYREWQENMYNLNWQNQLDASNTSYQRAMADMQAAGINPKLVAQLGGASTPSVSVPTSSSAGSSMPTFQMSNFNALSSLLSTYISGADSLDRNQNDFVKSIITAFIAIMPYL